MFLNCGAREDSWESFGQQGDPSSPSSRKSVLNIHWKDWCWSWNSNVSATWCEELTHWKRPWCWERLRAVGEGDERGWDDWMASPMQCTWVCINSGSWWWTGMPDVLQSTGSQRVERDWATELNWRTPTFSYSNHNCFEQDFFHTNYVNEKILFYVVFRWDLWWSGQFLILKLWESRKYLRRNILLRHFGPVSYFNLSLEKTALNLILKNSSPDNYKHWSPTYISCGSKIPANLSDTPAYRKSEKFRPILLHTIYFFHSFTQIQ